jgi:NADH-quinone oxidoreductase subunit I
MVAAPHPMVAGLEERDYYQGKVAKATPEQRAWADARDAELASSTASAAASDVPSDVPSIEVDSR